MIALRQGIPLLMTPNGDAAHFNQEWIKDALDDAAKVAGHEYWSIGRALTDTITMYLQQEFAGSIIKVSELEHLVQKLLSSLNHDQIAASFFLPDPPVYLSLLDLVLEAGSGYELAFFQLLGKRLQEIAESKSLRVEISDLNPCLRLLKQRLRLRCQDRLRDEIVNYIRNYSSFHFFKKIRQTPLEIELS